MSQKAERDLPYQEAESTRLISELQTNIQRLRDTIARTRELRGKAIPEAPSDLPTRG
jgi:hypothetical protein